MCRRDPCLTRSSECSRLVAGKGTCFERAGRGFCGFERLAVGRDPTPTRANHSWCGAESISEMSKRGEFTGDVVMRMCQTWSTVYRGLLGASLGAVFGAVVPAAVVFGAATCWWEAWGKSDLDRAYDRYAVLPELCALAVVVGTFFGCAGWATLAPREPRRFARTLAIIVATTLPLWYVILGVVHSMELTPVRYKGLEHPAWYPSEIVVATILLAIPVAVAAALTRASGQGFPSSEPIISGVLADETKTA